MRKRTLLLATSLTAGLLTLPLTTEPASAAPSGLAGDFNGDGYRDAAVAAPAATVGGKSWAGQVTVVYGTAGGLDPARHTVISQDTSGIPGAAETDDEFGDRLAAADLNRDGYSDLIVGAEHEAVGSKQDSGTVVILWGSSSGLSGGTTVKNPLPLYGSYFGLDIAAGDFTGDGKPDLAVSAQSDSGANPYRIRLIRGPFGRTGSTGTVSTYTPGVDRPGLTAGKVNGDTKSDLVVTGKKTNSEHLAAALYYQGTSSGLSKGATLRAGTNAAVGDIDHDGYGDIALGNPDDPDTEPSGSTGGEVSIVYGTSSGPSSTRRTTLTQAGAGVPDSASYGDKFGAAVALGDLDKDGYADLAVGAPGETFGDDLDYRSSAGAITLLPGSASGVTTTGAVALTQDSPGVPGTMEAADRFGAQLLASDVNGDGHADLTAIAAQENDDAGALWHLPGATGSLYSTTTSTSFGPTKTGLSSNQRGAFGWDLAG